MYEELKKVTDLTIEDSVDVLRKIPILLSVQIEGFCNVAMKISETKRMYDFAYKNMLEYYIKDSDIDVYKVFKVMEDREVYMVQNTKPVKDLADELSEQKTESKLIEQNISYLKTLQTNIRTILDYEQFRAGK